MLQDSSLPRSMSLGAPALKMQFVTNVLTNRPQSIPEISKPKTAGKTQRPREVTATPAPAQVQVAAQSRAGSLPSQNAKANIKSIFKAELRAEIEKNKSYPSISRRLGHTGTVVVSFTLQEDGHIIDVRLDTPSPFDRLNESAMEAVKKVQKFKPIPQELGEEEMDIKVPVNFITI